MLLFAERYRNALLSGAKTTTLRLWRRRHVRAGSVTATNLGIMLAILAVDDVAVATLTDRDARADGFSDRAALLEALATRYGTVPATLTRITFRRHTDHPTA